MRFCIDKPKFVRKIQKRRRAGIALILAGVLTFLIVADSYIRSIISGYPLSVASGVMLQLMDKAMDNVLDREEINPTLIDNVKYGNDGNVLSIETNTAVLNRIKTKFSDELHCVLADYGNTLKVSLPLGTLIGNEYTLGRGPEISFSIRYSYSISTDLKSEFNEAGINNTIHTFYLDVKNDIYMVIPWKNVGKTVNTRYILAETVIAGRVPEAYTGVYGASDDDADNIFNHRAEID